MNLIPPEISVLKSGGIDGVLCIPAVRNSPSDIGAGYMLSGFTHRGGSRLSCDLDRRANRRGRDLRRHHWKLP